MSANESSGAAKRGNGWLILLAVIFLAGMAGWLMCAFAGDAPRAWRALLINFVFFTPLSVAMVVWPAVVVVSRGEWARSVAHYSLAGLAMSPVSILAFIALCAGYTHWAGWLNYPQLWQGAWLNPAFVLIRDGVALLSIWTFALIFARLRRKIWPAKTSAWFAFWYCIVMSLIGFDMVMALDPHWYSALFGVYFFVGGLYAAVATWTLVVLINRPREKRALHDMGKLIVAFSLLTTYTMFSQLIVIWYGNLPQEVRFVIPRLNGAWQWASAILLVAVYLGPLALLLTRRSKRARAYMGAIAAMVLAVLWLERWWLVTPALSKRLAPGITELTITAAFAAALAFAIIMFLRRVPYAELPGPEEEQ
jgi:hypothetical protein